MARLRAVNRVRSVELRSSTKPDTGGSDQCPANRPSNPVFTAGPSQGAGCVTTIG